MWKPMLSCVVTLLALAAGPVSGQEPPPSGEQAQKPAAPPVERVTRLSWEQFRRRLKVITSKERLFLTDDQGAPLDETYFRSEVVGVSLGRERVYVATARHGIDVFRVDWRFKLERVSHLEVEGVVSGLIYDDPYLFVVRPVRRSQVFQLTVGGAVPVREGSLKAPPPTEASGGREKASGRVTRVAGGVVTVNLGTDDGFSAGDRIRVLSSGRTQEYNPLHGKHLASARTRLQAVLTLYEVEAGVSRARLREGEDVSVGDLVSYFNEEKTPQVDRTVRWGGVQRIIATATPGFLFGDPSVGAQLHYEYQANIPLTLGVSWRGFLGQEVSATDLRVDAAFDTNYFSIGYQLGFFGGTGDTYGASPIIGFSAMFIRLGMLDGLHLLFGWRVALEDMRGMFARIQLGGRRHNLFFALDMENGEYKMKHGNGTLEYDEHMELVMGTALVGDRIRLWGNGGADTLFVTVFLGGQFVNMQEDSSSSFVMGGGVEYRF
jgi:hypothetical protein